MISVLIVEDSRTTAAALENLIKSDKDFVVAGKATTISEGIELLNRGNVDVVLLDMYLGPSLGTELVEYAAKNRPTPIVVISTAKRGDVNIMRALQLGAVDFVHKPDMDGRKPEEAGQLIRAKLRLAATSRRRLASPNSDGASGLKKAARPSFKGVGLVVIGSSTGGPAALSVVLSALPIEYKIPTVIVQHINDGYTAGLAHALDEKCNVKVKESENNAALDPGVVYIARSGGHTVVSPSQRLIIDSGAAGDTFKPSVDALFESTAKNFKGRVLGIVLTGMGGDGTAGSRKLRERGHSVIVQDESSSVVWGMPGDVHRAGLSSAVLSLDEIAVTLAEM